MQAAPQQRGYGRKLSISAVLRAVPATQEDTILSG